MRSPLRFISACILALLIAQPVSAAEPNFCADSGSPEFQHGFLALHATLGAAMGEPLQCAHVDPASGDTHQRTSTGLAYYQPSTNTPAFTDGWRRWALTAEGLEAWVGSSIAPPSIVLPQIEAQVAALRGLAPGERLPVRVVDRTELREILARELAEDWTPREWERDKQLLAVLGLLQPEDDLLERRLDLLQGQVVGAYEDDAKVLYLVQEHGQFGAVERITYAHEAVHALQDHHHGLRQILPRHPTNYDQYLARLALIEGDAVLVQVLWGQQHLSDADISEILRVLDAPHPSLEQAPRVLREEGLFPYDGGFLFVQAAYQRAGDYSGVEALFRAPPSSTEQILHPEKYVAGDEPITATLPDLSAALGDGWRPLGSGVLGELYARILLAQHGQPEVVDTAAAGWGGDSWQLFERDGHPALLLRTVWDSEQDAREFFDAYSAGLQQRFGAALGAATPDAWRTFVAPDGAAELRLDAREVLVALAPNRADLDALWRALGR